MNEETLFHRALAEPPHARAAFLDRAGLAIADITLRRPSLDDVFLALTGHGAESTDGSQP